MLFFVLGNRFCLLLYFIIFILDPFSSWLICFTTITVPLLYQKIANGCWLSYQVITRINIESFVLLVIILIYYYTGKPAGLNGHYQIKPGNSQYGSVFVASYSMPKNSNLRAPPQFMLPVPAHLSPSEVLTHGKVDTWIPQVSNQVFDFDDANQKSAAMMSLLLARSSSSGRT